MSQFIYPQLNVWIVLHILNQNVQLLLCKIHLSACWWNAVWSYTALCIHDPCSLRVVCRSHINAAVTVYCLSSSSSVYLSVRTSNKNKTITCGQGLQGSKSTYSAPCKILKYKANDTILRQSISTQLNSWTILHTSEKLRKVNLVNRTSTYRQWRKVCCLAKSSSLS